MSTPRSTPDLSLVVFACAHGLGFTTTAAITARLRRWGFADLTEAEVEQQLAYASSETIVAPPLTSRVYNDRAQYRVTAAGRDWLMVMFRAIHTLAGQFPSELTEEASA